MERQSWCFAIWTLGLEVSLFHFISTYTWHFFFFLVFCFFLLISISSILSLFTIYLLDIDECKSDILRCDVNANCSNTYGSYKCTCKEGYNGTGHVCTGMMNLLRFNPCLRLGTGILSVESETFLGCFPILYFLKSFSSKDWAEYLSWSEIPNSSLFHFICPRRFLCSSDNVNLVSLLTSHRLFMVCCDLSSQPLSPPINNLFVVGKNICRASAAGLFPILLSHKPLLT